MINPAHFRLCVVRPTLEWLHPLIPYSQAAENLLLGTALVESRLTYLRQVGGGPARGVYQVEPATHRDVWDSWLAFRPEVASRVRALASQRWPVSGQRVFDGELEVNLAYATAIARLVYRRHPLSLPSADDVGGLAATWKLVYNTPLGAGTVEAAATWFARVVAGGEFAA